MGLTKQIPERYGVLLEGTKKKILWSNQLGRIKAKITNKDDNRPNKFVFAQQKTNSE